MVSYGLICLRLTQEWATPPLSVTRALSCGSLLPGLFTQRGTGRLLVQISPAAISRLPSGEKGTCQLRELCRTWSTPLGGRIPLQTWMDTPLDRAETEQDGACRVGGLGHDQRYALDWTSDLPVMEPPVQSVSWLRGSW